MSALTVSWYCALIIYFVAVIMLSFVSYISKFRSRDTYLIFQLTANIESNLLVTCDCLHLPKVSKDHHWLNLNV